MGYEKGGLTTMMVKRSSRTYRSAAQAHAKVQAAQQELLASVAAAAVEEPMHRYSHSIPQPAPTPAAVIPSRAPSGDTPAAMTQILEQLSCQSQLLVDLLGAVISLTAAVLCQNGKS